MVNTLLESVSSTDSNDLQGLKVINNNDKHHSESPNMANENSTVNCIAESGTGDSVVSDVTSRSKEYKHLIDYGLDIKVANRLDEIFKTGKQ